MARSAVHKASSYVVFSLPCYLLSCRPKYLPQLFSDTLSLYSSLNVRDQFSHLRKVTGKILVLYITNLIFLDIKLKDKRFAIE